MLRFAFTMGSKWEILKGIVNTSFSIHNLIIMKFSHHNTTTTWVGYKRAFIPIWVVL